MTIICPLLTRDVKHFAFKQEPKVFSTYCHRPAQPRLTISATVKEKRRKERRGLILKTLLVAEWDPCLALGLDWAHLRLMAPTLVFFPILPGQWPLVSNLIELCCLWPRVRANICISCWPLWSICIDNPLSHSVSSFVDCFFFQYRQEGKLEHKSLC